MLLVMRKTQNAVSPYFPHSICYDTTLYALALMLFGSYQPMLDTPGLY